MTWDTLPDDTGDGLAGHDPGTGESHAHGTAGAVSRRSVLRVGAGALGAAMLGSVIPAAATLAETGTKRASARSSRSGRTCGTPRGPSVAAWRRRLCW
jgi:hypothetical protein